MWVLFLSLSSGTIYFYLWAPGATFLDFFSVFNRYHAIRSFFSHTWMLDLAIGVSTYGHGHLCARHNALKYG